MSTYVIVTGRFFDVAAADADVKEAMVEINETIAHEVFDVWNDYLATSFQYQTGEYLSGNRVEPREDTWVVHDDIDKPYGPWLEGVGSRNAPVTSFEGYHALARAHANVNSHAEETARFAVDELVAKLNEPA
jgi:hypothetical protein